MKCQAKSIPESFFMVAAEAVANSLDAHDIEVESVVPHPGRIREVAENVATAVVLKAQADGLAAKTIGEDKESVAASLKASMWSPEAPATDMPRPSFRRSHTDFGGVQVAFAR
jgi:malic enzyme